MCVSNIILLLCMMQSRVILFLFPRRRYYIFISFFCAIKGNDHTRAEHIIIIL